MISVFPFASPAAACVALRVARLRLQTTFAASSRRYTCVTPGPDPHTASTTAPPLEENQLVSVPQASLATLTLDLTEPSGVHVQACHLSIGEPAPYQAATPSNPESPGMRVRVESIRPSGDPEDENVNQLSAFGKS